MLTVPPSPWFWPWLLALTTYGAALVALLWPQPRRRGEEGPVARIPAQRTGSSERVGSGR